MKTRVDPVLRDEALRFRLKFRCEDCAYWESDGSHCCHGYPTEPHVERPLEQVDELLFCKAFELA